MKALETSERIYYKVIETPWTQPVLTANGTIGGDSFAVDSTNVDTINSGPYHTAPQYAYKLFDGNSTTAEGVGVGYNAGASSKLRTITFYNPNPLKISTLTVTAANANEYTYFKNWVVYGSNDNASWEQLYTQSVLTTYLGDVFPINSAKGYKYYLITFNYVNPSYGYSVMREFTIDAVQVTAQESTAEDYTYYIENKSYKTFEKDATKEVESTPFVQPILTANGTLGGDSPACSASYARSGYPAWYAYNNTTTDYYWYTYGSTSSTVYTIFYNPNPIKVISIDMTIPRWSSASNTVNDTVNVYGSNDNSAWTTLVTGVASGNYSSSVGTFYTIPVSSQNYYSYYKIENTSPYRYASNNYVWAVRYISFNADEYSPHLVKTQQLKAISSNLKSIVKGNNWVTFEQPVLTANGTIGGDSFAVDSANLDTYSNSSGYDLAPQYAYKLFDGNSTTEGIGVGFLRGYPEKVRTITFYNPNPLKISTLTVTGGNDSNYSYIQNWVVSGSNDNTNWDQLYTQAALTTYEGDVFPINSVKGYKYHKVEFVYNRTGTGWSYIREFVINAIQLVAI